MPGAISVFPFTGDGQTKIAFWGNSSRPKFNKFRQWHFGPCKVTGALQEGAAHISVSMNMFSFFLCLPKVRHNVSHLTFKAAIINVFLSTMHYMTTCSGCLQWWTDNYHPTLQFLWSFVALSHSLDSLFLATAYSCSQHKKKLFTKLENIAERLAA